jgi:aldehyde dehydrogenase (NAD+)
MAYDLDLSFIYKNPTRIVFGVNSLNDLVPEINLLKGSKAFLVTDKGVGEAGLVDMVVKALGTRWVGTYDEVPQDSGLHIVNEAADLAREKGTDIVISLGGGSVIDTAKGVALLLKEGGKLEGYYGLQNLTRPQTPHVAIPTTAGTGSEVTWAIVAKDWEKNQKILFGDDYIIPNTAILDPVLTKGLPPRITGFTGMDALTHAIEAIHAMQSEPISDGMAFYAIRLIMNYLPVCVANGEDLFARGQQQIAATIAGIAFSNAQIGLVHAAAHSVGALFKVPHGLANSIFLPHVMEFNMDEAADRYALVAQAMGVAEKGMSDEEAGQAAVNAVFELTKKIGLPQKLSEVDVPESGLEAVAELALCDGSIVYNPKPVFEPDEIMGCLRKAY